MKFALPITLMAGALLVGCASSPKETVADCTFADGSNQAAPTWVCGAPIEGVELSAVGYADKSGAGVNFMKQMAATAARVELAQTFRVDMQNMVKQFAETTGSADSETVDMVNTSVTKQITKETLAGSKIFRQMATPTGGMVVVVGLDASTHEKLQKHALKTSMDNEQALWQKFNAEKSFDELADEMTNMD